MSTLLQRFGATLSVATALAFTIHTSPAKAEDAPVEEDAFGGIAHTTLYNIAGVTLSPAKKAGDKVQVTADVVLASDEEENKVVEAKVFSMVGDKVTSAPLTIAMSGEGGKNAKLTGEIVAAKGKNMVYVWIKDMYGNVTTEAPKMTVKTFPPNVDQLTPGGGDINNAADIVPDDLDILDTKVGYDDKFFYTYFKVQGNITGGTMDPPFIHVYGTKMSNPDVEESEGLLIGKVLAHAPLAPTIAQKFKKQLEDNHIDLPLEKLNFAILDLQKLMEDPKSALKFGVGEEFKSDGGTFIGKIPLEVLGNMPKKTVRAISIDIAMQSLEAFVPIPINCAHFTQLQMQTHDFNI